MGSRGVLGFEVYSFENPGEELCGLGLRKVINNMHARRYTDRQDELSIISVLSILIAFLLAFQSDNITAGYGALFKKVGML